MHGNLFGGKNSSEKDLADEDLAGQNPGIALRGRTSSLYFYTLPYFAAFSSGSPHCTGSVFLTQRLLKT